MVNTLLDLVINPVQSVGQSSARSNRPQAHLTAQVTKRTKKAGIVGKYGTRYGASLRKQIKKIFTKEAIHDHCAAFFDMLVEFIPARFYLPQKDDSSDHRLKAYFHGLSKPAKASLKLQSVTYRKIELLLRGNRPKEYREDKIDRKRKIQDVGEKELERARRLDEVKRENPKVAEKERWKYAAMKAMGQKVHDDPKLLKQSMKKEHKRKEKNAEKWKERKEDEDKSKEARQQKRKENITDKIKETKMRKIAKREKKLMRPGFQGGKKEYITKD